MPKVPKSVPLTWPVGPHYLRWVDGKGVHAWARYKLKSADWYRAALVVAVQEAGEIDRYVGIQMALDGVLTALCAAVDAAGSGLYDAVERRLRDEDTDVDIATEGLDGWETAFMLSRRGALVLGSERATAEALAGSDSPSPAGWLAQLRQVRDRAVQHNILVRRLSPGDDLQGRYVDVPGLGARPPVEYLRSARKKTDRLVEAILADVDSLDEQRAAALETDLDPGRRPGPRALPDLSARARMISPG